ncbi:uncharacterized protein LOC126425134 isoform X2 [Schistocerca serialis cubense]|uniref:uncharacterized protein LOC126425134 isoform X2 n=1 Tax=Schistocerca serialis cubense TaxID=2023355 RepID=UPI00214F4C3D|nr:uncharacterized protein LOC126425134 isoform X2 [Schistocerca serialis cubense]
MNGVYGDKTNAKDEDVKMESPEKISQKRLMDGSHNEQQMGGFYKMLRVDAEGWSGRHCTVTPTHHNAAAAHADTSIVPVTKPNTVAEMVLMHQCRCGCTLRMGTIIIAILFVSLSFVQIGTSMYYLLTYQDIDDDVNRGKLVIKTLLTEVLVYSSVQAICSVLLLYGAIQEKSGMVLPWVATEILVTIVMAVIGIIVYTGGFSDSAITVVDLNVRVFVCIISYVLLNLYSLVVVCSYYRTLREKPDTVKLIAYKGVK